MKEIRTLIIAASALALLGAGASYPARAEDEGWRGRGHESREHEWREHERREWCEHHPYQCERPPAVVYETVPPPVVVAPPPPAIVYQPAPVVAPSPSVELVIPLHLGH